MIVGRGVQATQLGSDVAVLHAAHDDPQMHKPVAGTKS